MEPFRLLWQRPPSDCPLSQLVHVSRHVAVGASGKPWGLCDRCFRVSSHRPCRRETPAAESARAAHVLRFLYGVLRITLVLEPRFALTRASSQNPFRRMHVRYVACYAASVLPS